MGAIADLWNSERGLLAVLLVVTAGVLAGLGHMTVAEWTEFAKWIFVTYAVGKTVTGAVQIIKGGAAADGPEPIPPTAADGPRSI